MKICNILSFFLIIQMMAQAQRSPGGTESVETEIFWLDLCAPNQLHSVTRPAKGRYRYEINWKNNLSFGLININQFKYDYKINSVPFAAFVDTTYSSSTTSLLSMIAANKDPYFDFSPKVKSPVKDMFKRLVHQLDSLIGVRQAQYKESKSIEIRYDTEEALRKNTKDWQRYAMLRMESSFTEQDIVTMRDKINRFPTNNNLPHLSETSRS